MSVGDRALEVLELWRDGRLDPETVAATEEFAAGMRSGLLSAAWATTTDVGGALQSIGVPRTAHHLPYTVVEVPMEFERLRAVARVSFDDEERLAGLFLAKPEPGDGPAGRAS